MTTVTDIREARLPKWAREALRTARTQRDEAVRTAREALFMHDPEGSKAVVNPYAEIPLGLGNPSVRFRLGVERHGEYADVRVAVDRDGQPRLEVSGGCRLVITPWASNVIRVEVTR